MLSYFIMHFKRLISSSETSLFLSKAIWEYICDFEGKIWTLNKKYNDKNIKF